METGGQEDRWRQVDRKIDGGRWTGRYCRWGLAEKRTNGDRRTGRYSETVGQEYLGSRADRKTKAKWQTGRYRDAVGTGLFCIANSTHKVSVFLVI
jgi:hypothetical protein